MVGVALLAAASIALGSLLVGAWGPDEPRPSLLETSIPSPTLALPRPVCARETKSGPPPRRVEIFDATGLVEGCSFTGDLEQGPMTRGEVLIENPPPSAHGLLRIVWIVSSCDTGATIRFSGEAPTYRLVVERQVEPPCLPATSPFAVELLVAEDVPSENVAAEMVDPYRPSGPTPVR